MAQPGTGSVDHGREPCPDRILDDIGGAFGMGAVGGGIWHLIKGVKNSPSGARTRGGIEVLQLEGMMRDLLTTSGEQVFVVTCRLSDEKRQE